MSVEHGTYLVFNSQVRIVPIDEIMYLLHVVVIYAVVVVLTKVSRNSYYRRYWDVVTCSIYFITFNPFRPYKLKCPFILK